MRRLLVLAAAIAVVALGASMPAAAASPEPVDTQAWTRMSPVAMFRPAPGHIYVGVEHGIESARAFVHVEADTIPRMITRDVNLRLKPVGALSKKVDDVTVLACPLTAPIVGSGEVSAAVAPRYDCGGAISLDRQPDGTWVVPLDSMLFRWRRLGDFGLALVSTFDGLATFRLGFDVTATALELPAVVPPPPEVLAPVVEAVPEPIAFPEIALPPTPAVADVPPSAPLPPAPNSASRDSAGSDRPNRDLLDVATPPAPVVLAIVGLGALLVGWLVSRQRAVAATPVTVRVHGIGVGVAAAAVVVVPTALGEANVYKLGLVAILVVGAIGLHLLVNWAGELSLAHAALVGLPAFVVATLSGRQGVSPIVLLPLGIIVGLVAGAVIGLPAIRARGLQVALVTLAAGVAVDRFFFTREWLVGDVTGVQVPTPSLGPLHFATSRSLWPVLAVIVIAAVAVAWRLYRSKIGRGLLWIKAQPDAAAAFGIPVARYRTLAYALAGGFAGLAGGLTAMWVQRLTPQAFPPSRSFTFLIVVALAGRGFLGGVAAAAAFVEGGRLFVSSGDAFITYAAPIALILTLTRQQAGLNGLGRQITDRLRSLRFRGGTAMPDTDTPTKPTRGVRVAPLAGTVLLAVGFAAIALAWYHAGNTNQLWIQNQEMISGGIGGLSLVVLGVGLLIVDALRRDRA